MTDDDYHEGQIERVDPMTNEIFLTLKRAPKSHIVRFKREFAEAAEGEHGAKECLIKTIRGANSTMVFGHTNAPPTP